MANQFLNAQEYANTMLLLAKNQLVTGRLVTGKFKNEVTDENGLSINVKRPPRFAPRVFQVKSALGAADRPAPVAVHRRQRDGGTGAFAMAHRRMRDAQRSGGCRQGLRAGSGCKVTQGRAVGDACRVDGAGQRREHRNHGLIVAYRTSQLHAPPGEGFIRYRDKAAFLGGGEGVRQNEVAATVHRHVVKVDRGVFAVVDEGPRLAGDVKGGAVDDGDGPAAIGFRGAAHVIHVAAVAGDQRVRAVGAHPHLSRAVVDAAGHVDGAGRADLANLAAAGVGIGERRYRALADDAAHDPILAGGARRYGKAGGVGQRRQLRRGDAQFQQFF